MRSEKKTLDIKAIDVHCHFGQYTGNENALVDNFMSADIDGLTKLADISNIKLSLVSPLKGLVPRGASCPVKANQEVFAMVKNNGRLMQWVIINPLVPETFLQAKEFLQDKKCIGIKIHPEEHCYPIKEYGESIFKFAAKMETIVETHSGEVNSLPEDFMPFANEYSNVKLILSHLGCSVDGDPSHQIRAIEKSKYNNIYTDTSSSSSLMPNLIEWAVEEIGAERILFGTDFPCYFLPMQRARIDYADIDYEVKEKIFRNNAIELFDFGENI